METAFQEKKLKFINQDKQPTALVAGGAGFLGSHLCETLTAQKFNVICVDNLSMGSAKQNIEGLLSLPNFSLWEEDINKPGFTISPAIPLTHVFHLASVEEYLAASETSLQTLLVNSLGTKNLLDLASERKAKFVLVSSTEVFHGALSQTSLSTYFKKEADPTSLSFSEAKRFAESLTAEYFKQYNLFTIIARIKDPYGPRMNLSTGGPLANLVNQAIHSDKIEIFGDGLHTLNPTYVTDIIFGLIKATLQGSKGEIFNLINPEKYTERAIAEHLKRIVGGIEIVYKKGEELELPSYPLIIGTAEEKIGWAPKVPLDQGLSSVVEFSKEKETKKETEETLPPPPVQELVVKKVGGSGQLLRWLILFASIGLIFWTSILPVGDLAVNIYLANRNLNQGLDSLISDKANLTGPQATAAENAYRRSEKASDRLWFTPLLRLNEQRRQMQNYLFFAENLAVATKFSAEVVLSVTQATEPSTSKETAAQNIALAKDDLSSAKRSLEIATSSAVDQGKLPGLLKSSYQNLAGKEKSLEGLVNSIEEALQTTP